ncbi:MAG TPA: AAA family ATPase [Solirubrobacteraceae bacterium]
MRTRADDGASSVRAALRSVLVERDHEVAALESALARAADGAGRLIVIDGPVGRGKSCLVEAAGDIASAKGMRVLRGFANELEQEFSFGLAIQLFEPLAHGQQPELWSAATRGAAGRAGQLLERGLDANGVDDYPLIHSLYVLAKNLACAEGAPALVLLVEDVHWADQSSLRFLAYLAQRLHGVPIALVASIRTGSPSTDPAAVQALRDGRATIRLEPALLTEQGVSSLVGSHFPGAAADFISSCHVLTGGNPFLLVELLSEARADGLSPDADTASRLRSLTPEAIVSAVVARLAGISEAARAVASAVSILGSKTTVKQAAEVAQLDLDEAARAADALAAARVIRAGEPLSFFHPLTRSAVAASISPLAKGELHRRAASVLDAEGAAVDVVAAHLLKAPPASDPRTVEVLRNAAARSRRHAPAYAAQLLERAAAEHGSQDLRPTLVAELAEAEASAGVPHAPERLSEAIEIAAGPEQRAQLALAHGRALYGQRRLREAADTLQDALRELDPELAHHARDIQAVFVSATALLRDRRADAAPFREALVKRATSEPPSTDERIALVHIALLESLRDTPRDRVRELAGLAWADGELLDDAATELLGWQLLTAALMFTDQLELALERCDAAFEVAGERESSVLMATAAYCRSWALFGQGRIEEAAEQARQLRGGSVRRAAQFRGPDDLVAACHLQRGDLDAVESAVADLAASAEDTSHRWPFILDLRAQLRLAQHRPQEALEDAMDAGEQLEVHLGVTNPGVVAWRSTAAVALHQLGETERATPLLEEELSRARSLGVTRVVIRDLRILGNLTGGDAGIELLREAVALGEHYPPRLESVFALADLGAALRRSNQRAAARDPLRQALELSHAGGMTALEQRVRTELTATGARPRRTMLSGIDALTPSESRVAEFAADGLTTRQIAMALTLSPKTVETHLRHVYQKLDVSSRDELSALLRQEETG